MGKVVGRDELHIIFAQRVGNHKMRPTVVHVPVGQVVCIRVRIVQKSSLFHDKSTSVDVRLWCSERISVLDFVCFFAEEKSV